MLGGGRSWQETEIYTNNFQTWGQIYSRYSDDNDDDIAINFEIIKRILQSESSKPFFTVCKFTVFVRVCALWLLFRAEYRRQYSNARSANFLPAHSNKRRQLFTSYYNAAEWAGTYVGVVRAGECLCDSWGHSSMHAHPPPHPAHTCTPPHHPPPFL